MMTNHARTEPQTLMERPAWKALEAHYRKIRDVRLRSLFADDPDRGEHLTAEGAASTLTRAGRADRS